ncbi:MAG: ribulose-phosphate 3-epimerase [Rhodoluna sp.]|nr:ribulose-phosphate 3-epimerase [Rhodoluna sp.]
MDIRIQPSILSADFANLETDFASISSADGIHVDVMDGHFVPNLTFGLPVVKRMQEISTLPLDVHLMIEDLDRWAVEYAKLGVFSVTMHIESCRDVVGTIKAVKSTGSRVGLAIKPATPISAIEPYLAIVDQVLVMSVEPGFGGQSFIPESLQKIRDLKAKLNALSLSTWLQVDGGINLENIEAVAATGADTFVAGSAVFTASDRAQSIVSLRDSALKGSLTL